MSNLSDDFFFDDSDKSDVLSSLGGDWLQQDIDLMGTQDLTSELVRQGLNAEQIQRVLAGGTADVSSGGKFDISKLLNSNTLGSLFKAAAGIQGANAARNQGKTQQDIANQLLANADPYKDYRQRAEIPFMLGQMQQYGNLQGSQNDILKAAMSKVTAGDPQLDTMRARMVNYNPLGGDYAGYQNKLQASYDNPLGVYNSGEYQALADLFGKQIARRDASRGRLSQYGDRAVEMQGNFLSHLDKYRSGLNTAAGTAGQVQGNYMNSLINGTNSLSNADAQQMSSLSGLFGNVNQGLNYLGGLITPRGTAGAGAADAARMQSSGTALVNAAPSSITGALQTMFGG